MKLLAPRCFQTKRKTRAGCMTTRSGRRSDADSLTSILHPCTHYKQSQKATYGSFLHSATPSPIGTIAYATLLSACSALLNARMATVALSCRSGSTTRP